MKSYCKLSRKEIEKEMESIAEEVRRPTYICTKCARSSSIKKRLCKPTELPHIKKQ